MDGSSVVREVIDRPGTENGETATYLTGANGPIYRRVSTSKTWYLYDGLGTVLGEIDATGTLSRAQTCDVYGKERASYGTSASRHRFVGGLGHTEDDETGGLTYMRARYYDPEVGRFLSEDPARDGINWYVYCDNNPVNRWDPDGRESLGEVGMSMGISGMLNGMVSGLMSWVTNDNFWSGFLGGTIGGAVSPLGPFGSIGGAFASSLITNLMNGEEVTAATRRALTSAGIGAGGVGGVIMFAQAKNISLVMALIAFDADASVDALSAWGKI